MDGSLPQGFELEAPPAPAPEGLPQGFELEGSPEEKYGTPVQQAKTFGEGALAGAISSPAASAVERSFGVKPEDIRGRQEVNPWWHGGGEAATLGAGMLAGTGEAALLGKVGEGAVALSGLAEAGEAASVGAKIGSAAVRSAAEMATMQGQDEVSKMILQDPDQTAQSAIANIGLATALGGVTGGAIGTINPLWNATIGPKVEESLSTVRGILNGSKTLTPKEGVEQAVQGLGLGPNLEPLQKAFLSEEGGLASTALERDRPEAIEAMEGLKSKIADSVADSAGIKPEEALHFDKADAGITARDQFIKEVRDKIEPIQEQLQAHEAENAKIAVPDAARLNQFGKLVERGQSKFTPTSEYAELYEKYGQQLLDHENIAGVQQLESELGTKIRGMQRAPGADYNTVNALQDIRSAIRDFKYSQIEKSISGIAGEDASPIARMKIDTQRNALNRYRQAAEIIDQAQDHFDLGHFAGKETLAKKLESMSGEQAANKLSFKNNRDAIPFLQKYFPETYETVRQNEVRNFMQPSMKAGAKKGVSLDVNKLADNIANAQAGQSSYLQSILPGETINRVGHAKTLLGALPDTRSSKTAKWTEKLLAHLPGSALAAIQFIAGHNPLGGLIVGEMASKLQQEVPDAIKMSYLKWLGSDQPIKAGAFKSMVDTINHAMTYQESMAKATKAVFKPAAMVLGTNAIPSQSDKNKLDKTVMKLQENPNQFVQHQGDSQLGHYMPEHQQALSQANTQALQYLQSIKPKPHILGPFKAEPPTPVENARYQSALNIASNFSNLTCQRSLVITPNDIQDLHNLYPALYKSMSTSLTNEMIQAKNKGTLIPYKTRIGLSLFLGSPVDNTMSPMSIMAAQPQPTPFPAAQGGAKGKTRKGTSTLGKSNNTYQTADQRAESDRGQRE